MVRGRGLGAHPGGVTARSNAMPSVVPLVSLPARVVTAVLELGIAIDPQCSLSCRRGDPAASSVDRGAPLPADRYRAASRAASRARAEVGPGSSASVTTYLTGLRDVTDRPTVPRGGN